jgi:hypothetical protein
MNAKNVEGVPISPALLWVLKKKESNSERSDLRFEGRKHFLSKEIKESE